MDVKYRTHLVDCDDFVVIDNHCPVVNNILAVFKGINAEFLGGKKIVKVGILLVVHNPE
jgi:hypothetical protein